MRSKLAIYREVQDNMSEGLRFYMSLQEAINTLRQQAGDFVLTRTIQRSGPFSLSCPGQFLDCRVYGSGTRESQQGSASKYVKRSICRKWSRSCTA